MEPNFQPAEPRSVAAEVRRLRGGDPDAADALARRATRLALRTAAALLESREEASDIAQDVAVDALRSLGKLRDPDAFDAWVHRITVRHTMRRLKHRRRAREAETPLALLAEAAQPAVPQEADPDALIAARQALAAALTGLPARQRLALALRYVHDLSDAEIAAALGCREGTVHALLSRGRQALRRDPQLIEIAIEFRGG
jgi:RNA polymerase sigma-70 factor (ECF subfamily)